ncbi:peptidoglycan editing factor PgeF [Legionella sp. km772]|uniref:peptidoglycan editing factor PgeF n=1 Tax=Legionella sp. km772 TaxID=2498111 RepID=UPI000F8D0A5D|nr:peptidoglycan editing factor PgeF [Legionella sp. km772]RUR07701.1 peptidoglycan editing factor PgeF [Legionella sp. km772]
MKTKIANWKAPANISALSTTRIGGFSKAPYDSNNLAFHVNDIEQDVEKNRQQLRELLALANEPAWLEQTHSTLCVVPEKDKNRNADAATTQSWRYPLAILTADCLPITLCNQQGTEIAAIHAGWRGLCNGIIENTLAKMHSKPSELMAWIGPGISQNHYETSDEVYFSFTKKYASSQIAFQPSSASKWFANLPLIAELVLNISGVQDVTQSNLCTYELKNEFYSYRRTPQTGRIATLIWFNDQPQD